MGSIPLVALSVKPPAEQDPLGTAAKLTQLKNLMQAGPQEAQLREQAIQKGQQNIQEQQYQVAQRKALNDAYRQALTVGPDGAPSFDQSKLTSAAAQAGYGSAVPDIMKHLTDYQKSVADLKESQQKIEIGNRDSAGALGAALKASGYDPAFAGGLIDQHLQDPSLAPQAKQGLMQMKQALEQADPDSAKRIVQQAADQFISQSPKYSQLATEQQKAATEAESAKLRTREFEAKLPGGALEDPSKMGLQDYLKDPNLKNEPLPPGKRNAATFIAWKAKQSPIAQISVAGAAGGGLSTTALDQAAEKYWETGVLPPGGRGVAALAQNRKIMNRAAELHPTGSLAANSAEYAANKKSLGSNQELLDRLSGFENAAVRNADMLEKAAKDIPDLGVKFANIPLRAITDRMIGTASMSRFEVLRNTTLPEFAKMITSANASGVLSDSARTEIEKLIGPNATFQSLKGALDAFRDEAENRRKGYQDAIDDIKKRLGSMPAADDKKAKGAFDWSKYSEHK